MVELDIHEPKKKLGSARDVFLNSQIELKNSLDGLVDVYREWVEEETYLANEYWDKEKKETKFKFWKAPKRGNDVYAQRVKKRLSERLPTTQELREANLLADESGANCLHIVLTIDQKQFLGNLKAAWFNLQYHLNKFLNAFRKRYGKCWVVKSVEAQENGFPHVHLFIISEHTFKCEWFRGEDYDRWLIPAKDSVHNATNLKGQFVNGFENLWGLGFVYVRGIGDKPNSRSEVKVLEYVLKDVVSDVGEVPEDGNRGSVLSLALNWLFRKQSFSISGEGVLSYLIGRGLTQTQYAHLRCENGFLRWLFGNVRYEWVRFCGIVKLSEPPPDGFVSLSGEEIDELEANAIGINSGVSVGAKNGSSSDVACEVG